MTDLTDRARALRERVNWNSNESVAAIAEAMAEAEKRGAEREREACLREVTAREPRSFMDDDGCLQEGKPRARTAAEIEAALRSLKKEG